MVSDFVEEHGGYVRLTDEEFKRTKRKNRTLVQEAREMLEYVADKEGCGMSEWFMTQVRNGVDIANTRYRRDHYTAVLLFNQSSCHCEFDEYALQAKNILVKDGGPRGV